MDENIKFNLEEEALYNNNSELNEEEQQQQFLKQKLEEIEREEKIKEENKIKQQKEYQKEFINYLNNRKKKKVLKQLMEIWLNTNKWKDIGKKLKIIKDDNNDEAFVAENMEFFNNINYETMNSTDNRVCRICFGGVNDAFESGKLISPCKCKGSMKYVHVNCLNEWRLKSANKSSYYQCDQCKYKYHFQRTKFAKILSNKLTTLFITFLVTYLYIFFTGFILKFIIQLKHNKIAGIEFPEIGFFNIGIEHHFYGFFVIGVFGALKMSYTYIFDFTTLTNSFFRLTRNRNNRKDDEFTLIALLIIGCIKFMIDEYKNVYKKSKETLTILEERILEVDDEEDEEDEEFDKNK